MSKVDRPGTLFQRIIEKIADSVERMKVAWGRDGKSRGDLERGTGASVTTQKECPHSRPKDTPTLDKVPEVRARQPSVKAAGNSAPSSELVVGIDFGSCWTKAIVRDINRRMTWAVPFTEIGSTEAYLQYTAIEGLAEGQPRLAEAPATGWFDSLKVRLLSRTKEGPASRPINEEIQSVAFLALILRKVKGYVHDLPLYGDGNVDWHFNVGVPVSSNSAQAELRLFRRVLVAAWGIASRSTIKESDVRQALQETDEDEGWTGVHPEKINAVPEVAAEVAGYANRDRPEGLQFLIDVGATTLDMAAFIVHEIDGSDHYQLLCTDVQSLGCSEFTKKQADHIGRFVHKQGLANFGMTRMPTGLEEFMPPDEALQEAFKSNRRDFCRKVAWAVVKVIIQTKMHRYPLAREWEQGLPTLLCGGGSSSDVYSDVLRTCGDILEQQRGWRWQGLYNTPLKKSGELEAPLLGPHDFHRLAVAHGLSHHISEIGEIHLPKDIPDAEGPQMRERPPEITV